MNVLKILYLHVKLINLKGNARSSKELLHVEAKIDILNLLTLNLKKIINYAGSTRESHVKQMFSIHNIHPKLPLHVFNDTHYVRIHKFGVSLILGLVTEKTVKPSTKY